MCLGLLNLLVFGRLQELTNYRGARKFFVLFLFLGCCGYSNADKDNQPAEPQNFHGLLLCRRCVTFDHGDRKQSSAPTIGTVRIRVYLSLQSILDLVKFIAGICCDQKTHNDDKHPEFFKIHLAPLNLELLKFISRFL